MPNILIALSSVHPIVALSPVPDSKPVVVGGFRTNSRLLGAETYVRCRTFEDTARKQKQPVLHALYEILGHPLNPPPDPSST